MAANWLETGNPLLSANDVRAGAGNVKNLKLLGREGYEEVARLRELAQPKELNKLLKR